MDDTNVVKSKILKESSREAKPSDVFIGSFRGAESLFYNPSPFPLSRGKGTKVEDSSRG
jgi:hypothetical protein